MINFSRIYRKWNLVNMITTDKDCSTSIQLKDYLWVDTRANLYDAVKTMGIRGLSQASKVELMDVIEYFLLSENLKFLFGGVLKDELYLIKELVDAGANNHIMVTMRRDFSEYMIQKLYLVLTYEDTKNKVYYLYMPDEVRENCAKCLQQQVGVGKQNLKENIEETADDVYVPANMAPFVEDWHKHTVSELDKYDDGTEEFKDFKKFVGDLSPKALLKTFGYNVQKTAFEQPSETKTLEFLPAISLFTDMTFPNGQSYNHRFINSSTVLQVDRMQMGDEVQYFNLYIIRVSKDMIKVAVCLGDVINSVYSRNVLGLRELPLIPKHTKHYFPYLYKHINHRTMNDMKKAYLNTISFNSQPRQWFVMSNIEDKGLKLWTDIVMRGPYQKVLEKPVRAVADVVSKIIKDISESGNVNVIAHLNRYMELGESSCELVPYVSQGKN